MKKLTPSHFSVCEKSIKSKRPKCRRIRETKITQNKQINIISEWIEIDIFSFITILMISHNVRNLDFAGIGPENENQEIVNKKTNAKVFEVAGQK